IIINGKDLMIGVECTDLKIVGCINMFSDFNVEIHLFHEFPSKAVACSFSEFESAAREFCIVAAADVLVAHKHLFFIIYQNTVNPDIEHLSEYFFPKEEPPDDE